MLTKLTVRSVRNRAAPLEFNSTFDGVVDRLPYLQSLGVTCLELMPITSLKLDFDWCEWSIYLAHSGRSIWRA